MKKECLICQKELENSLTWNQLFSWKNATSNNFCQDCQTNLWHLSKGVISCQGCGRSLVAESANPYLRPYQVSMDQKNWCFDCYRWLDSHSESYLHHQALMDYSPIFQDSLYRYKYIGDCRLAQIWVEPVRQFAQAHSDLYWWVLPSSPKHLEIRGFHPMGYLLQTAGIEFDCPWTYQGNQVRQSSKSRQDRLNLDQPFQVIPEKLTDKSSHDWLIFDDVYTTGATMMRAKESLFAFQKESYSFGKSPAIYSLSLARNQLK